MADTTSNLMQRMPAEIRANIFRPALLHDVPLTPAQGTELQRINLDLFTVNSAVHEEARDAFYEANIIRFRDPEHVTSVFMSNPHIIAEARHLEFYNPSDNTQWYSAYSAKLFAILPVVLEWMPQVKTITIGSDGLGEIGYTVRTWLEWLKIETEPPCVGIGQYQLGGPLSKVFVGHCRLSEKWKEVESMQPGYDVVEEVTNAMNRLEDQKNMTLHDQFLRVTADNFMMWVMMHHETELVYNEIAVKPYLDTETRTLVGFEQWTFAAVFGEKIVSHEGSPIRHFEKAGDVPALHELSPSSGSDALEWATELIAANFGESFAEVENEEEADDEQDDEEDDDIGADDEEEREGDDDDQEGEEGVMAEV